MRSLSEIETISKRASRAKGFSWGTSEEIGKCIRLLELFSLPGLKNLNQYLKNYDQNKYSNLKKILSLKFQNKTYSIISSQINPELAEQIKKTFIDFQKHLY